jgi:hypothetical protein
VHAKIPSQPGYTDVSSICVSVEPGSGQHFDAARLSRDENQTRP